METTPRCSTRIANKRQTSGETEEQLKSSEKKRRKKRRSSFINIVGRKSGDFHRPSARLCESIPQHLGGDERLERLLSGAIEYALMNLQHEMPDIDLDALTGSVRHVGAVRIETMRNDGLFAKACGNSTSRAPNPTNTRNAGIAACYQSRLLCLNKEIQTWDKLLDKERQAADKVQKQVDEMKPICLAPKSLSDHQMELLKQVMVDGDTIRAHLNGARQQLHLYVSKLESCVLGLSRRQAKVEADMTSYSQLLYNSMLNDCPDPRHVITQLLEM